MPFIPTSPAASRLSRKGTWLAHAALAALEVAALFFFAEPWPVIHGFSIDDAWIHQVVARTFAQTGTLGYAPGQFGAGATSYLWASLLAVNYRWLHVDPVAYTLALNVALYLGSGAMLLSMALRPGEARRPTSSPAIDAVKAVLVVALASVGGNCLWFVFSGMEATLVIFLSVAAIAAITDDSPRRATRVTGALAAGLLALTRPETMALGPFLAVASSRLGKKPREVAFLVAVWAAAVVLYFGVNAAATGSPMPATLNGRKWIWVGDFEGRLRIFLLWDFVSTWIVRLRNYSLGTSANVALGVSLGLAAIAVVRLVRDRRWGLVLTVLWALVHTAIYAVILPTVGHGGRYQPLLPVVYLLLVGVGSVALLEEVTCAVERLLSRDLGRAGGLLPAASLVPWAALVLVGVRDWSHDYAKAVVHIRTTEVGLGTLVDALPPAAKVASFDIGGIGYASHRPILDIGGLSETGMAAMLKTGTIWKYLRDKHVDYVVVPEEYDPLFPGSLNFAYRLHLQENPAVALSLRHAIQSPPFVWLPAIRATAGSAPRQALLGALPAIRATAGSAPRQALYKIDFTGKPGIEPTSPATNAIDVSDPAGMLSLRARLWADRGVHALADAGIRVRLSVTPERSDDGASTPDDAWWIQMGPWGVAAEPPRGETRVRSAQLTPFMAARLRPYLEIADYGGATIVSLHALMDAVRLWTNPGAQALVPPAAIPGMGRDGDEVLGALPAGLPCAAAICGLAYVLMRVRRKSDKRPVAPAAAVAAVPREVVSVDAV
jgi:hypothetical protein